MVRQERLDHQPPAAPARTQQAGCLGQQRHRLFTGPVARRQELAVEVEEGDNIGVVDAVEHRLRADVDPCWRRRRAVGSGDGDDGPPCGRLQLFTQIG